MEEDDGDDDDDDDFPHVICNNYTTRLNFLNYVVALLSSKMDVLIMPPKHGF